MAVKKTMERALRSQRYFITISYQDPSQKNDLQHFWITKNFPKNGLIPSLRHMENEIRQKELKGIPEIKRSSLTNESK